MKKNLACSIFFLSIYYALTMALGPVYAEDTRATQLPDPQTEGGKPLMQVLSERKSTREFSYRDIPSNILSNLLWAANGVNRADTGERTAPSTKNMQEIDIYVAKADGLYLYDAKSNTLVPILDQDIRVYTGVQGFVKDAPVNLIYVADYNKMSSLTIGEKEFYSACDTGFVSQNVYLFCASNNLATVVRGAVNKLTLGKIMKLRPSQRIILTQTIGYPS